MSLNESRSKDERSQIFNYNISQWLFLPRPKFNHHYDDIDLGRNKFTGIASRVVSNVFPTKCTLTNKRKITII